MTTGQEHLNWCADRALKYFDLDDKRNALLSFLSDVGKDERTAYIKTHPMSWPVLEDGYDRGRDAFKEAMLDFPVSSS